MEIKNQNEQSVVVPQREKEQLGRELKQNFTLPAESEELVKEWTLKKMATQFQTFKKNLTNDYIKQGKMPKFIRELEKLKDLGCICGI
jgi:predicted unusual protein kinase regulating ubiquinone biosynthesis (AarF/ABC1/UbiB family)